MGFNATVVVLLDRLHEIEKDPNFGKKLANAIRWRATNPPGVTPSYAEPYVTGQTQVVEVHHADNKAIVAVGANCGKQIGFVLGWGQTDEEIIKELNRQRLREKKEKTK